MTGKAHHLIAAAIVLAAVTAGVSASAPQAHAQAHAQAQASSDTIRTTPAMPTKVIVYEPFTRSGAVAPGIHVVRQSSNANCWEGAISSPRADAFRCSAGNIIYDPCILDPAGPPRLACWLGPGPSRVVLVTPERPFPQLSHHGSANVKDSFPWLIELDNGQFCDDETGASLYFPSIGRANWDCPHGLGWGTIHRDGQDWTMGYSSLASAIGHQAPRLTEIPIKTAWF
jgi:hypothetical protein